MIGSNGENLIFVFSLPRSGSTLLCALLGNHPEVAAPPEPWLLLRLASFLGNGSESALYDDQIAGLALRHFIDDGIFHAASREFAIAAYNRVLEKIGGQWLIDKTPRYYHILDFIDVLFPSAKKIWLKRNPYDVAASYKRRWGLGKDVWLGDVPCPASLDFAFGITNLIKYFDRTDQNKIELKYEDLISAPELEVRKLSEFCGIPFVPEMATLTENSRGLVGLQGAVVGDEVIRGTTSVQSQPVEGWKTHLTDEEIEAISNVVGMQSFRRLGYVIPEAGETRSRCFSLTEKERQALLCHIRERCNVLHESRLAALYDRDSKIDWLENEVRRIARLLADKETDAREREMRLLEEAKKTQESLAWAVAERMERLALVASLQDRVLFFERDEVPRLLGELADGQARLEQQSIELQRLKRLLKEIRTDYQNCRRSLSFRIGRMLTAPFRGVVWLIVRFFKSEAKNGTP